MIFCKFFLFDFINWSILVKLQKNNFCHLSFNFLCLNKCLFMTKNLSIMFTKFFRWSWQKNDSALRSGTLALRTHFFAWKALGVWELGSNFCKKWQASHSFLMNGGALQRALPSCIATGRCRNWIVPKPLICKKNCKEV